MEFIIVEGANGVGKSTFVNKLKDMTPNCGVLKLTGLPGTSPSTQTKTTYYHQATLNYMMAIKDVPGTMILDRSYLSEQVMAHLYKPWSFVTESKIFTQIIRVHDIKVKFIFLHCSLDTYAKRLVRDKVEFNNIAYDPRESIKQQLIYNDIYRSFPIGIPAIWLSTEEGVDVSLENAKKFLSDTNY